MNQEAEKIPKIKMKVRRNSLHPWVFKRMVKAKAGLEPGTLVDLQAMDHSFIGRGFYNPHSSVAVRLLSNHAEDINHHFYKEKVSQARSLREDTLNLLGPDHDSYRLLHSEADGLSGLVIDKFGKHLVVVPHAAGHVHCFDHLKKALSELFPDHQILLMPDAKSCRREHFNCDHLSDYFAQDHQVQVKEHGLIFELDLKQSHKTGFFLDQRDHRKRVRDLSAGHSVLDLCCYTGGFALNAAKGGAQEVLALDLDEKVLPAAEANAKRNQCQVHFKHGNLFDLLRSHLEQGRQWDMIILDPAKLALVKEEIGRALKMYDDMNCLAMQCLKPGGILASFSCTGMVHEHQFLKVLTNAASRAQKNLQIFHCGGASADHPFSTVFPEARYLKAVFSRVQPL